MKAVLTFIRGILRRMHNFYRDLPIRTKMLLILYVLILIPLILVSSISYKSSEEIIKEHSGAYSQDILLMIELRLQDFVGSIRTISQDLVNDKTLYEILKNESGSKDPIDYYENANEIKNILQTTILSRPDIQSICLVSGTNSYYFHDDSSRKESIKSRLPEIIDKVLAAARAGQGKAVWYLDEREDGRFGIYLARVLYNRDDYTEIGLQVIQVKNEFFEGAYSGLSTDLMRNIAIISSTGQQIAARNPGGYRFSYGDIPPGFSGGGNFTDLNGSLFVSYIAMDDPDWTVITYIPLTELYRDVDALRRRIVLISLTCLLLLSVLGLFISRDFVRPINRLVKGMERMQAGEEGVYVEEGRRDELGFLSKTFNNMASEIHNLVNGIYREQITRKEAELKALQSQINPHFLFNTLESINWMAMLNNVPEISRAVTDLADLLEAGVGRDDRLVTLEEEFEYAGKYISILKNRYEDRFTYQSSIEPGVKSYKIPRLLIQPLIENAVYHGVERCREKGAISLSACMRDGLVHIEVRDNGPGIDPGELEQLNERLSMDNNTYFKNLRGRSGSIGIENVNRRIKLFYGDGYGLQIDSVKGSHTRVLVTLPYGHFGESEGYYVQSPDR